MGFPIAIGSKSISVLPISHTNTAEPNNDEEEGVYPVFPEHSPRLSCFSTCPEAELQAVVNTICGYTVCKKTGIQQHRFAEVRVRVSPLIQPLSKSAHRESVFRLPLDIALANDPSSTANTNSSPRLQVVFSPDRRFLACLVPIDECQEEPTSIVVMFRLRMPRKKLLPPLPPTPSYAHTSKAHNEIVMETPVATSPRILRIANDEEELAHPPTFLKATCLCNVRLPRYDSSSLDLIDESALLLVGCCDGSVAAVSYHTAIIRDQLIHPATSSDPHSKPVGIKCMDQITVPTLAHIQKGRLCIMDDDGRLSMFDMEICADKYSTKEDEFHSCTESSQTTVYNSSNEDQFTQQGCVIAVNTLDAYLFLKVTQRRLKFAFSGSGRIVYAIWMTKNNMLAVLFQKGDNATLYILSCCDQDQQKTGSPLILRVLSQISLNIQRVKESAHTHVLFESSVQGLQSYDQHTPSFAAKLALPIYFEPIQYEATSQCFVINAMHAEDAETREAYALLWHWKSNTQGLSIFKTVSCSREDSYPNISLISCLRLAREKHSSTMFVADVTFLLSGRYNVKQFIRKDLFEVGLLSPACESRLRNNWFIEFNSPVFLTAKTVSFPTVKRRSIRGEYELEWTEACLPSHVRSPCMSAIGRRWGRSIAIACDVGLCTIDVGGKPASKSHARRTGFCSSERKSTTYTKSSHSLVAAENSIPMHGRDTPRWYQFGNDLTAKSFQVVGFSWWEGGCEAAMSVHDYFSDDILVAVLRTQCDGNSSYFLSCWYKSKLDLSHQLLKYSDDACSSQWGLKLAPDFIPSKLNVFGQPYVTRGSPRKAYVLLNSDNDVTAYLCFQLQFVPSGSSRNKSRNYLDIRPYKVLGVLAAQGSIGGPADVFIAGASFNFDLTDSSSRDDDNSHLVTIGVAREFGAGLDAMALSRNGVSHFGEVISSCCTDARSSSISSMWQAWSADSTASTTTQSTSVWVFHLLDDSIVTWIVPSFDGDDEVESECDQRSCFGRTESKYPKDHLLVSVHATSCKLGWSAFSGRALDWMQAPAKTTSMDFPLGPLQLGSSDCMMGVTQQCHKLHRSVGESSESLQFRCDFLDNEIFAPGAFRIKPPGFLPMFYSLTKHMVAEDILHEAAVLKDYSMHIFKRSTSQEACMLALQVFFFRVLEKLTDKGPLLDPSQCMLQSVLATSVSNVRTVSSPLHFSMLFLEVGRQIEPGCLINLFPLPGSSHMGRRDREEVLDLLEIALDQGALDVATATLPLLPTQQITTRYCCLILRELLRQLVQRKGAPKMGVDLEQDMRIAGDLFRYALKIGSDDSASDTLHYELDDEEEIRRPSALCALSNFFLQGKGESKIEKAAATFIISGFEEDSTTNTRSATSSGADHYLPAFVGTCKNVACCAIDVLIEAILPTFKETEWRRGALAARILIGSDGGVRKLTPENRISKKIAALNTAALEIETGGIIHFFRKEFIDCRKQINSKAASAIVDLIVLSCDNVDHQTLIPDRLLLILFVCLHCSSRSQEVLDSVREDAPMNVVFLLAQTPKKL